MAKVNLNTKAKNLEVQKNNVQNTKEALPLENKNGVDSTNDTKVEEQSILIRDLNNLKSKKDLAELIKMKAQARIKFYQIFFMKNSCMICK